MPSRRTSARIIERKSINCDAPPTTAISTVACVSRTGLVKEYWDSCQPGPGNASGTDAIGSPLELNDAKR